MEEKPTRGKPKGKKTTTYLTPRERKEKAKKKVDAQIIAQTKRARRIKKDIDKLKEDILEEKETKAGRLYEDEYVKTMTASTRALAEEHVLFSPNEGPQTDFLAAPEIDVLYGGAAGGGKSYAMIIDPLRYAHRAAHRALILRKTMPELRELIDKSRELYPKAFPGARYKEGEKVWSFPSGAKIEFGFLEKDADVYRYQGRAYSWIGFDEITHLPTEFAWNYLASRLRTTDPEIEVYMRCTTNPGGVGHQWVKERYIDPAKPGSSFLGKDGLSRKFIPARLSDNPYLADDGRYEKMLESLDEVSRRRLLNGDWNINEGIAFPEFNRDLHVIEPYALPTHWTRFKAIDYGYAAPSCCLWFAIDPREGTLLVYRELYQSGLTADELAQTILEMEIGDSFHIPGVIDYAVWNRTGYTGPTIGQTMCGPPYSLKLRPADKNRIAGKIQIHERLKPVEANNGRPGLQIFNNCKNLIKELESLPVDPKKPEDVDTKANDHAYDALRYGIMSRPRKESSFDIMQSLKEKAMYEPLDSTFGY